MLKWTPVVVADFFLGTFFLVGGIWSLRTSENVRIKTIKYLKAVWLTLAIFFYLEAIASLYLDLFWGRVQGIVGFIALAFLLVAISYNYKDSFISIWLVIVIIFGIITTYLAFTQLDAAIIEKVEGYYKVSWTGPFDILATASIALFAVVFFGWVAITLLYSPYILRRYSFHFFIGAFITSIISLIIFYIIESPLWTEIIMCIGLTYCNYVIYKELGILYILPFKPYRLTILNKKGDILIQNVWSRTSSLDRIYNLLLSTKSENLEKMRRDSSLFKKMKSELSIISRVLQKIKEIKNPKGFRSFLSKQKSENFIVEMKFPEILLSESEFLIVKFEASKITKFLRDLIVQFSSEFEKEFRNELENSIIEREMYESGYQLVNKFFYMFPSNIITSSKDSFLISPELFRIDEELETKIRELFPEEVDFKFVKCEDQPAPEITINTINKIRAEIQNEHRDV